MRTGISALVETLRDSGVNVVFGLPGTQSVPLFEEFRKSGIRTILATDELAAAFMAIGYFRASGRVAALATIAGPGLTYALTGLAEALHDSVGLLHLVATSRANATRAFRLQAIDQRAVAGPLVKRYLTVDDSSDVVTTIREAVVTATTGEPGPVIVELDCGPLAAPLMPREAHRTSERTELRTAELQHLADRFANSKYPVFLLGSGALGACDDLTSIARRLRIPVVTTPSARGLIREDDTMATGFDPLRATVEEVNRLFGESDLIVGLGCKLTHNGSAGYRLRLPPEKFVHVDANAGALNANYQTTLAICAKVEETVPYLARRASSTIWEQSRVSELRQAIREVTHEPEPRIHGPSGSMEPKEFFAWLRDSLPDDAIVVTDSGLHQVLARRYFEVLAPRGLVFPSDFQSMGFGLPAAIGAQVAAPGRQVVAIVGDGGFLMSGLELMTARREALPIAVIVFNDGQLNQIRFQQLSDSGRSHAVKVTNPDYEILAAALGLSYLRFDRTTLTQTKEKLRGRRGPLLMEVAVGDSWELRKRASIAFTKRVGRKIVGSGMSNWIKARFGNLLPRG